MKEFPTLALFRIWCFATSRSVFVHTFSESYGVSNFRGRCASAKLSCGFHVAFLFSLWFYVGFIACLPPHFLCLPRLFWAHHWPECYGDVWRHSVVSASPVFVFFGFAVLPFVGFSSRFLLLTKRVRDGSGLLANSLPFGLHIEEPHLRSIFVINLVDWTWYLHV